MPTAELTGQEREREGAASRDEPDQDQGTHAPGDWVRIEAVLTNKDAITLNDAAQLVAAEAGELAHG